MKTWQELLVTGADEGVREYGPNSPMAVNAFATLSNLRWFRKVGQPLESVEGVVPVGSWEEALAPWPEEPERYLHSGHLIAPTVLCRQARQDPQVREWWELARREAYDCFGVSGALPKEFTTRQEDVVELYVFEFVDWLMAEIVGVPAETSTHFRTMLTWFQEGRFPCGWVGDWPQGQWRIY